MAKILKVGNLADFISYLLDQVANHSVYVWGGQGQMHPVVTEEWIRKKEETQGSAAADKAVAYWKKQVAAGYQDKLRALDCSGLGTYYLYNLEKLISGDTNAEGLRGMCTQETEAKSGYWVFKQKRDGTTAARHIGYMVSDTELVHAAGEGNGIIKVKYKASDWWWIGKPKMFDFGPEPVPPTPPTPTPTDSYVEVIGRRVNIRKGYNADSPALFVARQGDKYPYLGTAPTGWYEISTKLGDGFISNRDDLTKLHGDVHPIDPPVTGKYVEVVGKSVSVRAMPNASGKRLGIVHKGDILPYEGTASTGWYQITYAGTSAFISNKPALTTIIDGG